MIDRWGKLAVSLYGIAIARKGLLRSMSESSIPVPVALSDSANRKASGTSAEGGWNSRRVFAWEGWNFRVSLPPTFPVAAAYLTVWAWMVARQAKHSFKLTDVNDTFQSSEHILCAYMDGGRSFGSLSIRFESRNTTWLAHLDCWSSDKSPSTADSFHPSRREDRPPDGWHGSETTPSFVRKRAAPYRWAGELDHLCGGAERFEMDSRLEDGLFQPPGEIPAFWESSKPKEMALRSRPAGFPTLLGFSPSQPILKLTVLIEILPSWRPRLGHT
ncbi:conserved hypothetical protein [Coccidioides posadasii str. Silveira]|uniref:Uncharacterized protein n=1 Tax=Coccidioides posadasii (strain RMSCC 757 / Silveira) TaxID=443226 RepID=E9DE53_COCPS|nr:conserved hypothetical protein [Coccidioides posadasii str. Silveira]